MEAVGYGVVECCKCLWGSLAKPISYISDPARNLRSLETELQRLMNKSADVERTVEAQEAAQLKERTNQVAGWLKEVQDLKAECERVLEEGNSQQHSKCLGWCKPCNYGSSYKLGKKVTQLLSTVRECQAAGQFDVVVIELPPPRVHAMPMEKAVGLDSMVSQVWGCLQAEDVGIIGLYGMGGVGKTTLMKRINEELRCRSHDFHFVRWVVVSKQINLDKIRDSIRKGLGITEDDWRGKPEDERAGMLYGLLSRKKFVLLIDDIWERLDLSKVGIPIPNEETGSKIVFTTRLEEICGQMEANKSIRVQCLTSEQALELFKEKVGQETLNLHQDIPGIAELIVEECKGLPLALITIGRAMATMKSLREWEYALNVLRSYPSKFSNMVDHVYKLLEFSYHSLKNSTLQQCFLYCALFPEDYDINKDHLIDLWIGEGFLCDTNVVYEAQLEGEHVIYTLKSACLLESGKDEDSVKMHDVIRDMALWLARDRGVKKNKILVEEGDVRISRWKEAERIAFWCDGVCTADVKQLECSRLITFLTSTDLQNVPKWIFEAMKVLRVLDMSRNTEITKIPKGVGRLVNLQYLNLSGTGIKALPSGMKYLTSLLYLLLDDTDFLTDMPREVISSLLSLKVFRKSGRCDYSDERGFVEGLECLHNLDELRLNLFTAFGVHKLFVSTKLQRCIRQLDILRSSDLTENRIPSSSLRKMQHLEKLTFYHCNLLKNIEIYRDGADEIRGGVRHRLSRRSELTNLHHVKIFGSELRNLSWLSYAPNLQELYVAKCSSLEKIFDDDDNTQSQDENTSARLFSSLTSLTLNLLPKLRSIHNLTLSSPSLASIWINRCPSLKKLPFDPNSIKNSLREIEADPRWWSGLEWDNEAAKAFFTSKFVPLKNT